MSDVDDLRRDLATTRMARQEVMHVYCDDVGAALATVG